MAKTTPIILGASIGTRAIGLAILKDGEVVDWHIKTFKQGWSTQKLRIIIAFIDKVIQLDNISAIAIKTPCEFSRGNNMRILLRQFEKVIVKRGLSIRKYTNETLKRYSDFNLANKQSVMIHMVQLYPCMRQWYKREIQNRNPYYLKIFEGLLAAHCYHKSQQEKK
jgi:RNase H-fold protein (predicted Holliday junction resolvase)